MDYRRIEDVGEGAKLKTSNIGVNNRYKIRTTKRHPVSITTIIHSHGFPLAQRETRDIGPDGMFIRTEPLIFPKNTVLALEFNLNIGGDPKRYRLPVFLGRRASDRSEEGLQLVFLLYREDVVRSYGNDLGSFLNHMNERSDIDGRSLTTERISCNGMIPDQGLSPDPGLGLKTFASSRAHNIKLDVVTFA